MNIQLDQLMIGLVGGLAILLSQDQKESYRRYACLFGLVAQPFWFYSAWQGNDWGIFIVCFICTWAWVKGFRQFWL